MRPRPHAVADIGSRTPLKFPRPRHAKILSCQKGTKNVRRVRQGSFQSLKGFPHPDTMIRVRADSFPRHRLELGFRLRLNDQITHESGDEIWIVSAMYFNSA